jgi:hypothetical protein
MQLYRDGTLLLQELNHSALKETPMKRLLMRTIRNRDSARSRPAVN